MLPPDMQPWNEWGPQFRLGLGLQPGQTLPGLIESLIPAQPEIDPLFTDPSRYFDELNTALEKAALGQDYTYKQGLKAPTSWYEGGATASDTSLPQPGTIEMEQAPALDMPAITDFTDYLRYPLMEGLTGALGGPSPFDTRSKQILEGPTSAINRQFDQSRQNLMSQYGQMDMLGSPAFNAQMRELERDRADTVGGITSQFAMEAAKADEGMRRNRLADIAGALTGERQAKFDEMAFQTDLARQAQQDYDQWAAQQQAAYLAPQQYQDEGLRLGLGGIGTNLQPAIGSSLQSLAGIFGAAGNQMAANQRNLSTAFSNPALNNQYSLWG
jgi:hypothetical protein